jgi:hypothetical protein
VRKLVILTALAMIVIKHRRRPVPHVSVFQLIGDEQARLLYLLSARLPRNKHIDQWKRDATVCGLMHLANNKPKITIDQP